MSDSAYLLVPLVVFALSLISVRAAQIFALRKALLDLPNERSSHSRPVPRLGGAAFIPLILLGLLILWSNVPLPTSVKWSYVAGALCLFVVSLVDDFWSLSPGARFVVQFAAAGIFITMAAIAQPWSNHQGVSIGIGAILVVGTVGLLNIYNFMDGIHYRPTGIREI